METIRDYPQFTIRGNIYTATYAKIAVDHFLIAHYLFLERCKDEDAFIHGVNDIEENNLICQAFSAFAIEAYMNDYISATLLDENYESFDRLSCISKLQLVSLCVFHKKLNSTSDLYHKLKALFRMRDGIAHNHSFDGTKEVKGMTQQEYEERSKWEEEHPEELEKQFNQWISREKAYAINLLSDGYDAIRTMWLLVDYFIQNGENHTCFFRMFAHLYPPIIKIGDNDRKLDSSSPYFEIMSKIVKPAPNSYRKMFREHKGKKTNE